MFYPLYVTYASGHPLVVRLVCNALLMWVYRVFYAGVWHLIPLIPQPFQRDHLDFLSSCATLLSLFTPPSWYPLQVLLAIQGLPVFIGAAFFCDLAQLLVHMDVTEAPMVWWTADYSKGLSAVLACLVLFAFAVEQRNKV